jgi:RNA methyltransferase, TrmH family
MRPLKHIVSRDNPQYKALLKLARFGRERRKNGQILIEGMHLLKACGDAGLQPELVVVSESGAKLPEFIDWLLANPDRPCCCLPDAMHRDLSDTETPTGVVARIAWPRPTQAPDPAVDSVLLDGVQDPGNLGTLLRTAAAAGFRQILLSPDCVAPWAPKTLRAGQGAQFVLSIHEQVDLLSFLRGFAGTSLTTEPEAPFSLYRQSWPSGPLAWVFGAEGQGVSAPVAAAAQYRLAIPMPGQVESLNVAAAAAICLFETVRRRQVG